MRRLMKRPSHFREKGGLPYSGRGLHRDQALGFGVGLYDEREDEARIGSFLLSAGLVIGGWHGSGLKDLECSFGFLLHPFLFEIGRVVCVD